MKHYVQKNFDAPQSVDPLMLDTSLVDMDNNLIEINHGQNKLAESLEGSLPSIQLNTMDNQKFM